MYVCINFVSTLSTPVPITSYTSIYVHAELFLGLGSKVIAYFDIIPICATLKTASVLYSTLRFLLIVTC